MSNQYAGGFISKTPPTVTVSSAQGMWTLSQQAQYKKEGVWPVMEVYALGALGTVGYSDCAFSIRLGGLNSFYTLNLDASTSQAVLAKYDSFATLLWQKIITVTGTGVGPQNMVIDSAGNFYISAIGYFSYFAMLTIKIDSSGNVVWAKTFSGSGSTRIFSLCLDSSGNVYSFGQAAISGTDPAFIAKYDSSGSLLAQKQLNNGTAQQIISGLFDSVGNLYIAITRSSSSPYFGMVLAKLNSSLVVSGDTGLYDASVSQSYTIPTHLTIDSSDSIYVVGYFNQNYINKMFIAKYNSSLTLLWQRQLYSSVSCNAEEVCTDSSNNVYVIGNASVSAKQVLFITKYNPSGVIQWQRYIQPAGPLDSGGYSITVNNGKMHISGFIRLFSGTDYNFFALLPSDGTKTGNYLLGGYSVSYSALNYTDDVSSLNVFSTGQSTTTTSLSGITPTAASNSSSLTSLLSII